MSGTGACALVVLRCHGLASLQDGGRRGYQRYGLSPSGAMDPLAMAMANTLVGNKADETVIEFGLGGGEFRVEDGDVRLAVAGAMGMVACDGSPVIGARSFVLAKGRCLTIAPPHRGVFGYLAVAGGIGGASVLGSRALHLRAGIGGIDGRPLRPGDRLDVPADPGGIDRAMPARPHDGHRAIRIMLGPQDDHVSPEGWAVFLGEGLTVSHQADRMGYRLDGPPIAHGGKGYNIVSDGTVAGSIQLPGNGHPIVLMADRQTTGGYPKIATVVSADLRRLAQRRPGDAVRFAIVDLAQATAAARARSREIAALPGSLRDVAVAEAECLGAANLAGDAVDALASTP
ncbi:biotin-dependent carboxyltransferase family protein [Methylobacterium sp. Leaf108]|uniref:5-oxoprolinase subunit C family protein n=1 Tax=Methylobacterium sp. Leaf108 TaxID=1736256 RepID=UPI0006FE1BFD|nr:biotin-dependent carboxyltransferase family protein [Methylobacterium sp. Leaf108]KQP51841.1 urea amidolyase [Methylobacterium sp. Leaf108]